MLGKGGMVKISSFFFYIYQILKNFPPILNFNLSRVYNTFLSTSGDGFPTLGLLHKLVCTKLLQVLSWVMLMVFHLGSNCAKQQKWENKLKWGWLMDQCMQGRLYG